MSKKINLNCPINSLSYGYASSYILSELSILGYDIDLFPIGQIEFTNEHINRSLQNAENSQFNNKTIRIYHQNQLHHRVGNGEHIGFPIFELDTFNQQEKNSLLSCDRLLVCSDWAKNVCLDNHINIPIDVIPLGVDKSIFYPTDFSQMEEIWYFNIGKWEIRKGHDLIPKAFKDAFTDQKVRLFMICNGSPYHYSKEEVERWQNSYKEVLGDKVHFIPRQNNHRDIAEIIRKCHCGIFPSRAEGWNLPLLETLACGRYAIATNCTAHTQFLSADNCFMITANKKVPAVDGKWFDGRGNWHEPNYDDLVSDLRYSYQYIKDNKKINEQGVETGKIFSWRNTAKSIINII